MQETQEMWVQSLGQEDPLEKEMATHSSILSGKSHGQRSPVGYSPWGLKESDVTELLSMRGARAHTHTHTHTHILTIARIQWLLYPCNCKNVLLWLPGSSVGKEFACNAGNPGLIPGLGRSLGEGIGYPLQYSWASLVAQTVKNLPEMQETWVWFLDWENSLEEGMAIHSSILVWRIPMDRGAWQVAVHGVAKS